MQILRVFCIEWNQSANPAYSLLLMTTSHLSPQDDRHLHGVPATTLVEAKHTAFCYWDHKERVKLGSFQEFVRHDMVRNFLMILPPISLRPRKLFPGFTCFTVKLSFASCVRLILLQPCHLDCYLQTHLLSSLI